MSHFLWLGANAAFIVAVLVFLYSTAIPGVYGLDLPSGVPGDTQSAFEKIRSPQGFILLVAMPGAVLLLGELAHWYRRLTEPRTPNVALEPEVPDRVPSIGRASLFLRAAGVLSVGVVAATLAMYLIAPRSSGDGEAIARVSAETVSIADHGGKQADGEAFGGDIQILQNAEDPRLRDLATAPQERLTALRQMLLRNTNRFESLTIMDVAGQVMLTTDEASLETSANPAYRAAVAGRGVAAAFMAEDIYYAAPILDDAANMYAVLLARTTPGRLWSQTLSMSIDGSRSFIVSPDGTLPVDGNEVLVFTGDASNVMVADVAGSRMYCSARPIGSGTHLDAGLAVATCLPAGIALSSAPTEQLLLVQSVAVIGATVALGVLILALMFRGVRRSKRTNVTGVSLLEARLLSQRDYYT